MQAYSISAKYLNKSGNPATRSFMTVAKDLDSARAQAIAKLHATDSYAGKLDLRVVQILENKFEFVEVK